MQETLLGIWSDLRAKFPDLKFIEETHTYYISGKVLPSVSTLLKSFYEEFNKEEVSLRYSLKRGFDQNDVKDAWQGENDIANNKGHDVHLFGEHYVQWKYFGIGQKPKCTSKQHLAIIEFWNDLPSHIIPVATELQMYCKALGYCGTADIITYDLNKDQYLIMDYKGLDINTPILTDSGWKTMGTITAEDRVFDKNGDLVKIKGLSSIKYDLPCYEITFSNKTSIVADHEHRWLITFKRADKTEEVIMTTKELYDYLRELDPKKRKSSYYMPKIMNCQPLKGKEGVTLPIDPYVLGLWLGDGSSQAGVITNMYPEIWKEIEKRGYKIGPDIGGGATGKAQLRTIYGLHTELRKLGLLFNKHLPEIYLLGSYEQRLDLLRGFMDADGHYARKFSKAFIMGTTKQWQAEAIATLVSSMGITTSISTVLKYCRGNTYPGFNTLFRGDINPFLIRNQDIGEEYKTKQNHSTFINIKSVELVESRPTRCIEVESPTHTFLFGRNFTVTHNTNKTLFNDNEKYPAKPLINVDSKLGLKQENFGKYALQFSFYQILLEEVGLKVGGRILIYLQEKDNKLYQKFNTVDATEDLRKWLQTKFKNGKEVTTV